MVEEKSVEPTKKRSRACFKKSRGACLTCKIRHIKCDEAKPECIKCKGTGRVCEYHNPQDAALVLTANRVSVLPGLSSTRSSKEHRYFDRFRQRTILGLMGVNDKSAFWRAIVLQLSEAFPAVLHAVIAISTLHEHLDNPTFETRRMFLQQYNKSIRHIRTLPSENQIQVTLTCCIIFVCLENAQGNHERALEHLESGLKILNTWKSQRRLLPSEKDAQDHILEIISRLDAQATSFWDSRKPTLMPDHYGEEPVYNGDRFSDLHAAKNAAQYYEIRILYVLTAVSPKGSRLSPCFEDDYALRIKLLQAFNRGMVKWKKAFNGLCLAENAKWGKTELQNSLVLRLHHEAVTLLVDLRTNSRREDDSLPPSEYQRYQSLIDISRTLIDSRNPKDGFDFSADAGVVSSLYFTAMTAPTEEIYQQAIDLLRRVKRREGFWDAEKVARIAETIAQRRKAGEKGDHLNGGVLKLAELAGVDFRTSLYPWPADNAALENRFNNGLTIQ
ncbi:C6 zinc finger domain protein [Rutstroemia sp. NJR-2017a BBW]|nr:C6 zinc finger domain protein [Rutstroemia sp. NJR-2017a BBW]